MDNEYVTLMGNDPQVKYSITANKRYTKYIAENEESVGGNSNSKANTKDNQGNGSTETKDSRSTFKKNRHNILIVDENNKVNYENIRSVPGSFHDYDLSSKEAKNSSGGTTSSTSSRSSEDTHYLGKISQFKTKSMKMQLTSQNNEMNRNIEDSNRLILGKSLESNDLEIQKQDNVDDNDKNGVGEKKEDVAELKQYLQDSIELNKQLRQEYKAWKAKEMKMFMKKELMLDANLKIDLFTKTVPLMDVLQADISYKITKTAFKSKLGSSKVKSRGGNKKAKLQEQKRQERAREEKDLQQRKNNAQQLLVIDHKKINKSERTLLFK